MIAGCYALNDGLDLRAGEAGRALVLVGTINLYELLLIGLGVFLIRSRNIVRDGRTLLLLQAVFLADLTFLNGALANADLKPQLEALVRSFDSDRTVRAFETVDRAIAALDRNASPKIVADWLALNI